MMAMSHQSRRASLAEAAANVVAGYVLAIMVQRLAYPLFGIETTLATDTVIAAIFTAASLLRSYALRRLFIRLERRRERDEQVRLASLERRLATGRLLKGR